MSDESSLETWSSSHATDESSDNIYSPYWASHGLPWARNCNGRPVREPPIFDYSHIIGEVFEKKSEALINYFKEDVVRTTEVMDKTIEELKSRYRN